MGAPCTWVTGLQLQEFTITAYSAVCAEASDACKDADDVNCLGSAQMIGSRSSGCLCKGAVGLAGQHV